jgi:hypothetical protein
VSITDDIARSAWQISAPQRRALRAAARRCLESVCRWPLGVAFAVSLAVTQLPALGQGSSVDAIRAAFLFGCDVGAAARLQIRHPTLQEGARSLFDQTMKDAATSAQRLGTTVDTAPVPVDAGGNSVGVVASAMNDRAQAAFVAIDARWGTSVAYAFMLGFRAMLATEYVPLLPVATAAEVLNELREMARRAGVSAAIVERYAADLRSPDRRTQAEGSIAFRRNVLAQLEAAVPLSAEQGRRLLNTWLAGSQLSLAALGRAHGAAPAAVDRMFAGARERARALGIQVPSLPESDSKSPRDLATVLYYLMNEVGERVVDSIRPRLGEQFAALFELSVKMPIAIILYGPEPGADDLTPALVSAIERTAKDARLPQEIWRGVPDKMRQRRPHAEVKADIQESMARIETHYRRLAGE